jgi:serine/threonine protein kinase
LSVRLAESQGVDSIIRLIGAQIDERAETAYLVMEAGEIDLASLLQRQAGKPFNHNFVGMYWQQMLSAVHQLHEMRVVHSDLKPANFLSVQVGGGGTSGARGPTVLSRRGGGTAGWRRAALGLGARRLPPPCAFAQRIAEPDQIKPDQTGG